MQTDLSHIKQDSLNDGIQPSSTFTPAKKKSLRNLIAILIWPLLILILSQQHGWEILLRSFETTGQAILYENSSLLNLFKEHLLIVGYATALIVVTAIPLAIFVTRPSGAAFLPLVRNLTTISQTLPPMAVLFLFLPVFGFGSKVVIFSLFLFGLMPTLQATLTGIASVDEQTIEAAKGIGLSPSQILFKAELPLALPAILSGLRTSVLLIIATAALSPMVGAESLGSPIIVGFGINSPSQILQGAIAVALVSISFDFSMRTLEKRLTQWRSARS